MASIATLGYETHSSMTFFLTRAGPSVSLVPMAESIGVVEFSSIGRGYKAADRIDQTGNVKVIEAGVLPISRFFVLFSGPQEAVEKILAELVMDETLELVESTRIDSPHTDVLLGFYSQLKTRLKQSLGIIEAASISRILGAVDLALKSSAVELIEIRPGRESGGRSFAFLTGNQDSLKQAQSRVLSSTQYQAAVEFSIVDSPGTLLRELF